jgi:hypothetical protein
MGGVRLDVESLRVQGGSPWLGVNHDTEAEAEAEAEAEVGVLEDANRADASAAAS